MPNFFIRGGNASVPGNKHSSTFKRKNLVYADKHAKKRKPSFVSKQHNEEISSDSNDEDFDDKRHVVVDTDEEAHMTAQEKKLHLAKKYLKEIEEEEKEKHETDEVDSEVILGRLKENVLEQEGRLRRKIADKIRLEFNDVQRLMCKDHNLSITCLTVSTDYHVYTGSKNSSIVKWSLVNMKKVDCIPPRHKNKTNENLHNSSILCLAVSLDNKYLASGDEDKTIQIWDPKTMSHLFSFKGHRAGVTGLGFCRGTQNLYSCSRDKTVKVWSIVERAYIETLFGHQTPITGLDVISKDKVITSGGTDNTVRLWKIQEESQLIYNAPNGSTDVVKRLDDFHFVSCGDDGSVCLWGVSKKKPLFRINAAHGFAQSGEPNWVSAVGCLSNSEVFASGSSDGYVKLWKCDDNYRNVNILASIPVTGIVNALSFTPDQKKLVIGVGQEHKLGRWFRIKEAKNCIIVVDIWKQE